MELFGHKLIEFEGRINRQPFILIPFVIGLICVVIQIIAIALGDFGNILLYPIGIANLIINVSLEVRRLHDLDKSGWWCLISLIPVINLALAIYLIFFKGTDGPNRFGPDPLAKSV